MDDWFCYSANANAASAGQRRPKRVMIRPLPGEIRLGQKVCGRGLRLYGCASPAALDNRVVGAGDVPVDRAGRSHCHSTRRSGPLRARRRRYPCQCRRPIQTGVSVRDVLHGVSLQRGTFNKKSGDPVSRVPAFANESWDQLLMFWLHLMISKIAASVPWMLSSMAQGWSGYTVIELLLSSALRKFWLLART